MRPVNIHVTPTDLTRCEVCGKGIRKGELRMEEETGFSFVDFKDSTKSLWYHLPHAAEKKPRELLKALSSFSGKVPGGRKDLVSAATKLVREIDAFFANPEWKLNDRGNRVISGPQWTLTIFKKKASFNWVVAGSPRDAFASLSGGKPGKRRMPAKETGDSQFGPGFFDTPAAAAESLWLFLRSNAAK